jgi:hypothetical protein
MNIKFLSFFLITLILNYPSKCSSTDQKNTKFHLFDRYITVFDFWKGIFCRNKITNSWTNNITKINAKNNLNNDAESIIKSCDIELRRILRQRRYTLVSLSVDISHTQKDLDNITEKIKEGEKKQLLYKDIPLQSDVFNIDEPCPGPSRNIEHKPLPPGNKQSPEKKLELTKIEFTRQIITTIQDLIYKHDYSQFLKEDDDTNMKNIFEEKIEDIGSIIDKIKTNLNSKKNDIEKEIINIDSLHSLNFLNFKEVL